MPSFRQNPATAFQFNPYEGEGDPLVLRAYFSLPIFFSHFIFQRAVSRGAGKRGDFPFRYPGRGAGRFLSSTVGRRVLIFNNFQQLNDFGGRAGVEVGVCGAVAAVAFFFSSSSFLSCFLFD